MCQATAYLDGEKVTENLGAAIHVEHHGHTH